MAHIKKATDGYPENAYHRAAWEETIKGGSKEEIATRVVERFANEPDPANKKWRTNPANYFRFYDNYLSELVAAGLITAQSVEAETEGDEPPRVQQYKVEKPVEKPVKKPVKKPLSAASSPKTSGKNVGAAKLVKGALKNTNLPATDERKPKARKLKGEAKK